jgi:outer membrane biosynthesis protein TonB
LVDVRKLALSLIPLLLVACAKEVVVPPARETIAVRYVSVPKAEIRSSASPTAEVISTRKVGEKVSVLADQGEWSEVEVTLGSSGWIQKSALSDAPESGSTSENVRFATPPNPVYSQGGAKGEILLEASVNTDGDVTSVRTILNTTGNAALEARNQEELKRAKFYPMIRNGKTEPFIYVHRAQY